MIEPSSNISHYFFHEMWVVEIIIGLAVILGVNYGLKLAMSYLRKNFFSKFRDWRKKIDQIVYLPLQFLLGIFAFSFVIDVLGHKFGSVATLDYVAPFRNAAIIGCLVWIVLRWKKEAEASLILKDIYVKSKIDPNAAQTLGKLLSAVILIIAGMIILQILGLNIVPLLAFGGIGAAGIAFAAKDVMANCFGGLLLFIQRPFKIGDTIILLEKNIEGVVEEIGWYFTTVRDKEKRPIYFPNALFSTMLVVNVSRASHRRIYEKIRIRYNHADQMRTLSEEIKKAISECASIDTRLPLIVNLNAFGEYGLDLLVDVYSLETKLDAYYQVKQEVLMAVIETVAKTGASVAIPVGILEHPVTI